MTPKELEEFRETILGALKQIKDEHERFKQNGQKVISELKQLIETGTIRQETDQQISFIMDIITADGTKFDLDKNPEIVKDIKDAFTRIYGKYNLKELKINSIKIKHE